MKKMNKFFIYLVVLISLKLSNSCEPPDCDRLDCGTCGNACCTLEFLLRKFKSK